jgi:hypothetical protein
MNIVTGLVLIVAGAWIYRIGIAHERRHGRKRK